MNPNKFSLLIARAAVVIFSARYTYAAPSQGNMTYDFNSILPTTELQWTPCFDNYTCARLAVPLDYSNTSVGTTAIAFIKLSAKYSPESAENILWNNGGPGQSGVGYILQSGPIMSQYLNGKYNLVGFDPRGVNNSGPYVDCFSQNPDARTTYQNLFYSEVSRASSISLDTQFYSADIFGKWCSPSISQNSSQMYISTPLVAQDMLTYAQAEQKAAGKPVKDAKLWYFGQSYGTVIGATFASLFPTNVGRAILDGVVDAEDYYRNAWRANLYSTDEAVYSFITDCQKAGSQNCSFWGPTVENITLRMVNIITELKHNPIPVAGLDNQTTTGLATYSDLKQLMLLGTYFPLEFFPVLANIFYSIESHNNSAFIEATSLVSQEVVSDDFSVMIKCIDGNGRGNYSTIEDYRAYVHLLEHQSRYLGECWANNAAGVLCRSVQLQIPKSITFQGSLPPSSNHTAFPLLFLSNTIDPVAPIQGAYKMSKGFPGSTVLVQEGTGHTVSSNGASNCIWNSVNLYLDGKMPPANLTCKPEYVPFRDLPPFLPVAT